MTISANFPAINPALLLDFASTRALDPRITFSRPTTATYYDNHTTVVAEQNLALYSQDFTNAAWGKSDVTVGTGVTAPDGTSTANSLTSTSSDGYIIQSQSMVASSTYTISMWLKAASATTIKFGLGVTYSSAVSITTSWQRFTFTTSYDGTINRIIIGGTSSFPSSAPVIYIWGAQLEQRSTVTAYTPTTTTAITNYIPVLLTQQSNEARFDHNPTTRESLGLLIEEQRTNLQTYSSDFSNAVWTKSNSSVTADTIIAPDGTQTGDKWIPTTTGTISTSRLFATNTVSTATAYTSTAYVKYSGRRWVFMGVNDTSTSAYYCWFDVLNGVVGTKGASVTSTSITSVGNNWYKISATVTTTNTTNYFYISSPDADNSTTVTADSFSGLFIWGAQLEAGGFSTSYIPTVASQVTRSADSASMTSTNFSSWFNNAEGTMFTQASTFRTSGYGEIFQIGDVTSNRFDIGVLGTSGYIGVTVSGVSVADWDNTNAINANKYANQAFVSSALAYKVNDMVAVVNGTAGTVDTSCAVPVVDRVRIGFDQSSRYLNGYIKKLAYYPIRVSNVQLQGLTGS